MIINKLRFFKTQKEKKENTDIAQNYILYTIIFKKSLKLA